jgi:phage terminase large subunit-like protein
VIDYEAIETYVKEVAEQFLVMGIAIDRWGSTGTASRLLDEGLPVMAHGMGFASMSPACKEVQRLILAGDLRIANSPVTRWCFTNVVIEGNPAGDIKITKTRCKDKVDGATATAMACGIATAQARVPSVYEVRPEFLTI